MRILIALTLLVLPLGLSAAEVYKWRDERGVWHFGDEAPPGAEKIEVGEPTVYSAPPAPISRPQRVEPSQAPAAPYTAAAIARPGPEETVRNAPGDVSVSVALDPPLRSGHRIQLYLDEKPIGEPVPNTEFSLRNVDRGAHTVSAEILDSGGEVLTRTGGQTFYLHRPTVR